MNYLFFDTETTGPNAKTAQIVQLAALLTDRSGRVLHHFCFLIKCDHVPEEATAIHGITTEMCMRDGIDLDLAIEIFDRTLRYDDYTAVAHNIAYDLAVIRHWRPVKQICAMKRYKKKIGARDRNGKLKNPTLAELYKFATGKELIGAHDAWTDVLALKESFFALERRQCHAN